MNETIEAPAMPREVWFVDDELTEKDIPKPVTGVLTLHNVTYSTHRNLSDVEASLERRAGTAPDLVLVLDLLFQNQGTHGDAEGQQLLLKLRKGELSVPYDAPVIIYSALLEDRMPSEIREQMACADYIAKDEEHAGNRLADALCFALGQGSKETGRVQCEVLTYDCSAGVVVIEARPESGVVVQQTLDESYCPPPAREEGASFELVSYTKFVNGRRILYHQGVLTEDSEAADRDWESQFGD